MKLKKVMLIVLTAMCAICVFAACNPQSFKVDIFINGIKAEGDFEAKKGSLTVTLPVDEGYTLRSASVNVENATTDVSAKTVSLTDLKKGESVSIQTVQVADYLVSDSGYEDYAENVFLNTEKYPQLNNDGLFWHKYDETTRSIVEYRALSAEGAALIDINKPTIIFVHGLLLEVGRDNGKEKFIMRTVTGTAKDFDGFESADDVYDSKLWLDKGYNVGLFHYEHFVDATSHVNNMLTAPLRIWDKQNMEFVQTDENGELVTLTDASDFSVAQFFAAEYIRAVNALPDGFGKAGVRVAGHSMGGVASTAGVFLLTELAADGQLSHDALPDRLTLLDSYISVHLGSVLIDNMENPVAWSGKIIEVKDKLGNAYLECIKTISQEGIAIESIVDVGGMVNGSNPAIIANMLPYITYVALSPDYATSNPFENRHVGIFDLYSRMIADKGPLKDSDGNAVAGAQLTTQQLLQLKGKQFRIVQGNKTATTSDDVFEEYDWLNQ